MVMFITILRSIISLHLKWYANNINQYMHEGWSGSNSPGPAGCPELLLIPNSAQIASVATVLVTPVTLGSSHTA